MRAQHSLARQPHDAYFKTVFAKRENVIRFLKHFLSLLAHQVLALIDLTSLEFINTEVVSSTKLSKLQGDVLLRFRLKNSDRYLYILVEHQSSGDKEMNLRLEEYKVQLRKKLMKTDKKLPYIFPICVWAMKKPYQGTTSVEEMYHSDEAHQVLDNLPPLHIDFAQCDTLELVQAISPEVALVKRNLENKQYLEASKQEIINAIETGKYHKNAVELLYLHYRINKSEIDQYFSNYISQIPDKYKEIFMSAALYYKQEGRQEGREERTFSIAKNMLAGNFDINVINKMTGLPMESIRGLQVA